MARPYLNYVLSFTILITLVSCQTLQEVSEEGQELLVSCDADIVGIDETFVTVERVTLSLVDGTNVETEMAKIQKKQGLSGVVRETTEVFNLELWNFDMPIKAYLEEDVADDLDTRQTMKIIASKKDSKCSDGGLYRCAISYYNGQGFEAEHKDVNHTVIGTVSIDNITHLDQYLENTTATFTCSAAGPQDNAFRWHRRCPMFNQASMTQWSNWPNANVIKEDPSIVLEVNGDPNDCNTYNFKENLEFIAEIGDNNCQIRCQFGKDEINFQATVSASATLMVVKTFIPTTPPGTGAAKQSSSDDLAIGLGVGLTLLVVTVVIVLVYIFCFRRKKNDEDKDREAPDNLDSNNVDPHAPPPVFYSKPNKPPKSETNDRQADGMTNIALDTSYDSNRGPPRYANSPDGQGPPEYNTNDDNEPQRRRPSKDDGQENRGFSLDPDPTSDGGRRHRNRVRSNRSHNSSRDYDEEPHNRSYDREPHNRSHDREPHNRSYDRNPEPHNRSYDRNPEPRNNDYDPQPPNNAYNPQPSNYDYDRDSRPYNPRGHNYSADDNADYGDPSMGTAI